MASLVAQEQIKIVAYAGAVLALGIAVPFAVLYAQ